MNTYQTGEISVKGTVNMRRLMIFCMKEQLNEHMMFTLGGDMSIEDAEEYEQRKLLGETVRIYSHINGEENLICCGILTEVEICVKCGCYSILMKGASASWNMTTERKKRSFQNIDGTYRELMKKIVGKSCEIRYQSEKNVRMEVPVIQYNETDWNVLCRLASQLHAVLIPDVSSEKNKICLGISQRNTHYLNEYDILQSVVSSGREGKWNVSCIARLNKKMELGDTVFVKSKKWIVVEKQVIFRCNQIEMEYTLGRIQDYIHSYCGNNNLCGIAIHGKVLKNKDEYLKIWLDIDAEQKEEDAYWYPYLPETGNLLYAIPEKGAAVMLYFPNEKEKDGIVIHSLLENRFQGKKRNHKIKEMTTPSGKKMKIESDRIAFSGEKNGKVYAINLGEEIGVQLLSGKSIRMIADEGINISSGLSCSTSAVNRISVSQEGDKNKIEMWGNQIVFQAEKYQSASKTHKSKSKVSERDDERECQSFSSMHSDFTGMITQGDCGIINEKVLGGIPVLGCIKNDIHAHGQLGLRIKKVF